MTSKEFLAAMSGIGVEIKSAQSGVTREVLLTWFEGRGGGEASAAPAAEAPAAGQSAGQSAEQEKAPAKKAAAKKTPAKKTPENSPEKKAPARKSTRAQAPAEDPAEGTADTGAGAGAVTTDDAEATASTGDTAAAPAKKTPARKRTPRKTAAQKAAEAEQSQQTEQSASGSDQGAEQADGRGAAADTSRASSRSQSRPELPEIAIVTGEVGAADSGNRRRRSSASPSFSPLFLSPDTDADQDSSQDSDKDGQQGQQDGQQSGDQSGDQSGQGEGGNRRRRRGRRGRGRGRGEGGDDQNQNQNDDDNDASANGDSRSGDDSGSGRGVDDHSGSGRAADSAGDATGTGDNQDGGTESDGSGSTENTSGEDSDGSDSTPSGSRRRRRRRRRSGGSGSDDNQGSNDDPPNTEIHERDGRRRSGRGGSGSGTSGDEVQGITGSTRLEAKRQRRRDGREAGRRRQPILSESEFLARRESVDRVMVVREKQREDGKGIMTQVGVLEDKVLVEHFVTTESARSMVGNVYLGRVQNVLPSMEAAFVDIGRGRNGVLYAGEVNWEAAGLGGKARRIEQALKPGDMVLVQVTKDPIGQKGARLSTQISLAGRFLVYVPDGNSAGISRKLPDTERRRLKAILKDVVPEGSGVIIRTAAEGVSEEEIGRDVERLATQWTEISEAADKRKGSGSGTPVALYEEPDLLVKVVRDLFNEDFTKLVIQGETSWNTVHDYVMRVAPEMVERLERYDNPEVDVFATHRVDEQLAKALERKVWLPSGGSLVIDRTEAMTVVDVNTGKYTGSGGNLEETVTKNNLEAAEEIVRQLRLRDIGGIIVVDFIDMVLESNRDLVLRRLVECLGRDRTRHQVAEVTSLGLVQMTRKRIGTGLLEAFSENCEHCAGRGVVLHDMPIEPRRNDDDSRRGRRSKGGKNGNGNGSKRNEGKNQPAKPIPSPKDVAAVARPDAEPVIRPEDVAAEEAAGSSGAGGPEVASGPAEARGAKEREDVKASAAEGDHSRGKDASASESAGKADTTVVEPGARDEATPTARTTPEPAARPEAESPAADAAPTVSTVTRSRRSARSGVITPKASEPVVTPETPEVPTAAAATAPPPKLVTRSRRRGAARDAAAPQEDGAEEGGTA
ncbi:MAG TPA: Rne/Rng family ribonuclease [Candidatus Dietzia merdigallinarum]|nr:Rne/Rng family ribonuclease [Candidatus Dietzia merdigallinarum]